MYVSTETQDLLGLAVTDEANSVDFSKVIEKCEFVSSTRMLSCGLAFLLSARTKSTLITFVVCRWFFPSTSVQVSIS